MNWTGGHLQRHSRNADTGAVHRQKQHFARLRTLLQNGTTPLGATFRPNYVHRDEVGVGEGTLPFSLGSIHHIGHSKKVRMHSGEDDISAHVTRRLSRQKMRKGDGESENARELEAYRAVPLPNARTNAAIPKVRTGKQEHQNANSWAQKSADATLEDDLLEANKKRLLERRDWAGLASSRPLHMHFQSSRNKGRIGKRRKLSHRPAVRHGMHKPMHGSIARVHGPFMSGAIVNDLEAIRIRVGTDAFASQLTTQDNDLPNRIILSQEELSEPMLFDLHQDPCTTSKQTMLHEHSIGQITNARTSMQRNIHSYPYEAYREAFESSLTEGEEYKLSKAEADREFHNELDVQGNPLLCDNMIHYGEDRHWNEVVQEGCAGSDLSERGVTQEESKTGPPTDLICANNEPSHLSINRLQSGLADNGGSVSWNGHAAANSKNRKSEWWVRVEDLQIVDDTSWKDILAIPDRGSSRSATTKSFKDSVSNLSERADNQVEHTISVHPTLESTCATVGNLTNTQGPSHFGSTSSIDHVDACGNPCGCPIATSNSRLPAADAAEELWKKFVFEEGNSSVFDIMLENASFDGKDESSNIDACNPRPQILASIFPMASSDALILPTSSTLSHLKDSCGDGMPYNAGGRMEDNASLTALVSDPMDNNIFGLTRSASPAFQSNDPSRQNERSNDRDRYFIAVSGGALAKEQRTMTHTSLDNNVSFASPPSSTAVLREISPGGRSNIDNGLEHRHGAWSTMVQLGPSPLGKPRTHTERLELQGNSSGTFDIADSDEVDLVDPDRVR